MTSSSTASPTSSSAGRRLQRSQDRTIGGVAAGLADYANIDVSVVRLGFVALTIFGGSGPFLYLAAWLILPEEPVAAPGPPPPTAYAAPMAGTATPASATSATSDPAPPADTATD